MPLSHKTQIKRLNTAISRISSKDGHIYHAFMIGPQGSRRVHCTSKTPITHTIQKYNLITRHLT